MIFKIWLNILTHILNCSTLLTLEIEPSSPLSARSIKPPYRTYFYYDSPGNLLVVNGKMINGDQICDPTVKMSPPGKNGNSPHFYDHGCIALLQVL